MSPGGKDLCSLQRGRLSPEEQGYKLRKDSQHHVSEVTPSGLCAKDRLQDIKGRPRLA